MGNADPFVIVWTEAEAGREGNAQGMLLVPHPSVLPWTTESIPSGSDGLDDKDDDDDK